MTNQSQSIAVITDSTCDLPREILERFSIHTLPLKVIYPDGEYSDGVDIDAETIYQRMPAEVPKTSMVSMGAALKLFATLREKGIRQVFAIHIASTLSGTVDMIRTVSREFSEMKIEVIDSRSASMGMGFLSYAAAKLVTEGLHFEEIKDRLHHMRERIRIFCCVPALDYLRRGGRIGAVAATVGSLIDIKPIISMDAEGKIFTFDKVRGRKRSIERLIQIIAELGREGKMNIAVMHGAAKDEALKIQEALAKLPSVQEIMLGSIGPVIGIHTGPGLVGVAVQML
ncbi:MAG TPA: DegV family protein [Bacillota bacterium]